MEEEVRPILQRAVATPQRLGDLAVRLFSPACGGAELELPPRETQEPPEFGQMIVLDTNVISEFMTSPPAEPVSRWLNAQDAAHLYLTTISIAEICFGLRVMPGGKRRRLLTDRFEQFLAAAFDNRILSFDEHAARVYGEIRGQRNEKGRPMSNFDGQIAAIARSRGCSIASRNIKDSKDFKGCGLKLTDPFAE